MNLTTGFPRRTGDIESDHAYLYAWAVSLVDELKSILCNLDSSNVTEAGSVKAQNIDVSQARIKDAQLQSLTADKLTAGTIDTGRITIQSSDASGSIKIADQYIVFTDRGAERIALGRNENGKYIFTVTNRDGSQGIYMDENGDIGITGLLQTRSKAIIGTSIEVGYGADPSVKFMKPSGAVGAELYFDDSQNALVIKAENVIFTGKIAANEE